MIDSLSGPIVEKSLKIDKWFKHILNLEPQEWHGFMEKNDKNNRDLMGQPQGQFHEWIYFANEKELDTKSAEYIKIRTRLENEYNKTRLQSL